MAIQFTDFSRAPLLESPDLIESAFRGYELSQKPREIADKQKERLLSNQLKQLEVEHKPREFELNDKQKELANAMQDLALKHRPKEYELSDAYKQAQINDLNNPQLKGALAQAFKIRDNLDPNSPSYDKDLQRVNNYIDKLGMQNGQAGTLSAPIEIQLPNGEKGYIQNLGKSKPGWQAVTNAQGQPIGYNVPLSDKQVEQWKAKTKFDVIYPFMNKSLSYYTGAGSNERFARDVKAYKYDDAARQRIDDYFAAKKLISIGSTTENARIGGHATNVQLKQLKDTLDSSEVFQKIEKGKSYVLPRGHAERSGNIFKDYLDKVEESASKNIPSHEFRPLNPNQNNEPGMQSTAANKEIEQANNAEAPEIINTINGITQIKFKGKTYKIPEKLVDRFMEENSPPAFGGQYG